MEFTVKAMPKVLQKTKTNVLHITSLQKRLEASCYL